MDALTDNDEALDPHREIALLEQRIEQLSDKLEGCRKFILAARIAMALGGAISGEHGIGTEKKAYLTALEDPAKLELMRRIKRAFDPHGILNPGKVLPG